MFKQEVEKGIIAGFPLIYWATDNKFFELFRTYLINPLYYLASLLSADISYPCCDFYEKNLFLNTNGFDERTPLFTGFDLNKDLRKYGKLKLLPTVKCFTSDRRVKDFGLPAYCMTGVYAFLLKVLRNKVLPLDFYKPVR